MVAGIVFFILFLTKIGPVDFSKVNLNWNYLMLSFLIQIIALVIGAYNWFLSLIMFDIKVPFNVVFSSHSLSILGKYIPGRIWTVLNRSAFIAQLGYDFLITSFIYTRLEVINILVGLLIGIFPLFLLEMDIIYRALILIAIIALLYLLVNKKVQKLIYKLINKITKSENEIDIPSFEFRSNAMVMAVALLQWVAYSMAFFFFVRAIFPVSDLKLGFAFPLSMTIGFIAFFTPGGLFVRESVLLAYFALFKLPLEISIAVSVLSRFWLLVGELFIFILGFIFKPGKAKKIN